MVTKISYNVVCQADNIKNEADQLISQRETLMQEVERQKQEAIRLYENGNQQQQIADELLADADVARDLARRAVTKAEDTLREANETLKTLKGILIKGVTLLCISNFLHTTVIDCLTGHTGN